MDLGGHQIVVKAMDTDTRTARYTIDDGPELSIDIQPDKLDPKSVRAAVLVAAVGFLEAAEKVAKIAAIDYTPILGQPVRLAEVWDTLPPEIQKQIPRYRAGDDETIFFSYVEAAQYATEHNIDLELIQRI